MTQRAKRLLVLMADTGSGHRSAAEAIAEAIDCLYHGAIQTEIVDVLIQHTPFPLNRIGHLYAPVVHYTPRLWRLLWEVTDNPTRTRWLFATLRPWLGSRLRRLLLATQPDAVISVHPVFNHLGLWALRQIGAQTPFITVVTDLVRAHAFWFCPNVNLCLTPTAEARQDALRAGQPPARTHAIGLPVSPRFTQRLPEKQQARTELGLYSHLPVVLLMGGGEGIGRIYAIARAVAQTHLSAQMVVIAGRNKGLQRRLEAVKWEIPTRITGFVTNVPQWMAAADVLVTKAGPGVLSEAFIVGLPLVLSGAIPGQEVSNVGYAVAQGAAISQTDPARIVRWLADRLRPGDEKLARMAAASRRLARPNAALQVARQIVALLPGAFQEAEQHSQEI